MTMIRGLADRLNTIQKETGHRKSMRAFRDALLDERWWRQRGKRPPSFSEEAMRNYHLRREPPSSYLIAVAERFEVNPSWLMTGEGLPFMEDVRRAQAAGLQEADHPLWPGALSGVPVLAEWPTAAKVLFLDVLDAYLVSFEGWPVLLDDTGEVFRFDAVEALARDIFEMVNVSYHSMRPLNRRDFTQYMVALLHAVQMRFPDPGEGPHIYYRFPNLDAEYRERVREDMKGVPDADVEALINPDWPLTEVTPTAWGERRYWPNEDG